MMEWKQAKWRIVVPKTTMYKFFGDSREYAVDCMYNRSENGMRRRKFMYK